jgi:hypothetical protein
VAACACLYRHQWCKDLHAAHTNPLGPAGGLLQQILSLN